MRSQTIIKNWSPESKYRLLKIVSLTEALLPWDLLALFSTHPVGRGQRGEGGGGGGGDGGGGEGISLFHRLMSHDLHAWSV